MPNETEAQDPAYAFFYRRNFERLKRVFERNFFDMFEKTLGFGPEIYGLSQRNKDVSFGPLMEKHCRVKKGD